MEKEIKIETTCIMQCPRPNGTIRSANFTLVTNIDHPFDLLDFFNNNLEPFFKNSTITIKKIIIIDETHQLVEKEIEEDENGNGIN